MITATLLVIGLLTIFVVSFFSPRKCSRIQHKAKKAHRRIHRFTARQPKAVQILVDPPASLTQKGVHKSAHAGKKVKQKLRAAHRKIVQR